MLSWLKPNIEVICPPRLTLWEASEALERSVGALYLDCQELGISTKRVHGGCLDKNDFWTLYLFGCWHLVKSYSDPFWRGRRRDYWIDCPNIEDRIIYTEKCKTNKADSDILFHSFVEKKRERMKSASESELLTVHLAA